MVVRAAGLLAGGLGQEVVEVPGTPAVGEGEALLGGGREVEPLQLTSARPCVWWLGAEAAGRLALPQTGEVVGVPLTAPEGELLALPVRRVVVPPGDGEGGAGTGGGRQLAHLQGGSLALIRISRARHQLRDELVLFLHSLLENLKVLQIPGRHCLLRLSLVNTQTWC